ncbi:hypothetical protein MTF66_34630 [Pseudoalteromonas sp. 2CM39R]|uniref:hypothetical protein n=1 Tax=Pseudoalteromonas sp. 2CM39R TaxID=2929856 RepID=UPI0020C04E61|nr:hypothetical protein [Pseudoalteromonas sp. 2CM39R]MCK8130186.1 hypothetical protein [Pseudoalteromonas sp. 2CM39R]
MATASLYARNKFHAYGVRFLYFELGFNLWCGSMMLAEFQAQKNRLSSVYVTFKEKVADAGRILKQ